MNKKQKFARQQELAEINREKHAAARRRRQEAKAATRRAAEHLKTETATR